MKLYNLKQGSPEWHEWRKSGIGSSDIATIMGKNPYETAFQMWTRIKFGSKKETTPWMQRGHDLEPIARKMLCDELNIEAEPACARHNDISHFIASFDGLDFKNGRVVEIKVPGKEVLEMAYNGQVPMHYQIQMQWQIHVSGFDSALYVVYDHVLEKIIILPVEKDEALIDQLVIAAFKFWENNIQDNDPPGLTEKDYKEINDEEFKNKVERATTINQLKSHYTKEWDAIREEMMLIEKDSSFRCLNMKATKLLDSISKEYDIESMRRDGIDVEKYCKQKIKKGTYRFSFS